MKHFKFRKICLQIFLFLFLVSYKYYSDDDSDDDEACRRQKKMDQNRPKNGPQWWVKWLETQSNGHAGIAPS